MRLTAPVLALLLATGCATYTAKTVDLLPSLASGDYATALATLDDSRRDRDELLYQLQRGLVLHQAGRWEESNVAFEAAEQRAEDLYTKSVSQAAASYIANDTTVAYRAEPFEMAMIPYYRSLNYVYLGQPDGALVEARKASYYLERYVDFAGRVLGDEASWAQVRELLKNNAFLQYYSGLLYDWHGATNDAFIAYRNAADAYATARGALGVSLPPRLGADLLRTGRRLGFLQELEELEAKYPDLFSEVREADAAPLANDEGRVVLLLELGNVPPKVQQEINFPILSTDHYSDYDAWAVDLSRRGSVGWRASGNVEIKYWLRVALPRLLSTRPSVRSARVVEESSGSAARAVPVEDLQGRARVMFDAEQPKIVVKAIARALLKYAAKREADEKSEAAGWLVNFLGAATEKADTRNWTTLPSSIAIAILRLPAATHDLRVEWLGEDGRQLGVDELTDVVVRANDWTFVAYRLY